MKRSKWKFLVVDYKFLKKLKERNNKIKQIKIKTRKVNILPLFMKNNISVYNGKTFFRFKSNFFNIGHKIGSFIYTRKVYNLTNNKPPLKNKKK